MGLAARARMELSASDTLPSISHPVKAAPQRRSLRLGLRKILLVITMTALLGTGIFLRIYPSAGYDRLGTDERDYMVFVKKVQSVGIWNYDAVVRVYVERQYKLKEAAVPATRIAFLVPATLCADLFGMHTFNALHAVAVAAGCLLLLLCALFAYRLGGTIPMLGMTAIIATAPLHIYLSQRALIDGYFAFWAVAALWLLWENLQHPRHLGWLAAYGICLTILVLTKENAAFVVFALFGIILLNRFLSIGTVTLQLYAVTIIGPIMAVLFLALLVGGLSDWIRFYLMFVTKSRLSHYSVIAQDGPWFRYLVDFVLIAPALVPLALGRIFQLRKSDRSDIFMTVFLVLTLAAMSSVTYGMSLRYAAFCDIPLAWLACQQVCSVAHGFPRVRPAILTSVLFLVLSAVGFSQYVRYFVTGEVYDPTTAAMVWTSGMEKAIGPTSTAPRFKDQQTR